jgi:peptidoglycan/xylan/chitin deacetylase (PgdA/CDA1 family)
MLRSPGVVVFSSKAPRAVLRLVARIRQEVPQARVCGILYQRPSGNGAGKQSAAGSLYAGLARLSANFGSALLRVFHAYPKRDGRYSETTLADLERFCKEIGCGFLVTPELVSSESLEFVRKLNPDLGIVYGTVGTASELFDLPREGCLMIRKGQWLDCRGSTTPALEDVADSEKTVQVSVLKFRRDPKDAQVLETACLPLEPFETPVGLALKTNLIGNDLLIRALGALASEQASGMANGRLALMPPVYPAPFGVNGNAEPSKPKAQFKPWRSRPAWNLFLRTVMPAPWVLARNWYRRWRGSAPVVILFHHLVTDRPHQGGIPTELFWKQVRFLKKHYRIATLNEAVQALEAGQVKEPMVVLTMDDGYRDNFLCLRAVTEEEGIPVSLFISTDYMSTERGFEHDKKWKLDNFLPLTWEQLRYLSRTGFEIGSHTRSHFNCGSTDHEALEREIVGSKIDLERQLGQLVEYFAFPWGQPENMSPEAVQLAQRTYAYFFSACGGVNFPSPSGSPRHLRRRNQCDTIWELELQIQSLLDP